MPALRNTTPRRLAALELLQAHRRLTGPQLAERLAVDDRTVRRDIQALIAMGIPVAVERGRDGGYLLAPGYRLPPMVFNDDEALALLLGLQAVQPLGLPQVAVASAQAKLARVMPAALQARLGALAEHVALAPGAAADVPAPVDAALLALLSSAARRGQRVALRYQAAPTADGQPAVTQRLVDPYGLGLVAGQWYLAAHCQLRGAMRSFRLDRVVQAEPVAQSFGRPAAFDVLAHLRRGLATVPRAHRAEVCLHTSLAGARALLVPELLAALQPLPGRWPRVLWHCEVDDLQAFSRTLARLPVRLEVRGPPALAQALARHARQLLRASQARP